MNKYIKKGLMLSASLLLCLSVSTSITNANARKYHYRSHRCIRHCNKMHRYGKQHNNRRNHHNNNNANTRNGQHKHGKAHKTTRRKRTYQSKPAQISAYNIKSAKHLNPEVSQILLFENQMKIRTLEDINNDRKANGVRPLPENPILDQVAQMRARQITYGPFSHYDAKNGNIMYADEDAQKLGIDDGGVGENIAGSGTGLTAMEGDPKSYNNKNGYDMADMDEDSMMNYDQNQGNGHRQNILSCLYKSIGIGVYADPSDPTTYNLAEDFTVGYPRYNKPDHH